VSLFVIGGGLSPAAELLLPRAYQAAKENILPPLKERLQIRAATLGNNAGIIGAALLLTIPLSAYHKRARRS
jgi:glucokinase